MILGHNIRNDESFRRLLFFAISVEVFGWNGAMKHVLGLSYCPHFGFFEQIHYHRLDRPMHTNIISLHKHRVLDCDTIRINNRLVSSYKMIPIREAFKDVMREALRNYLGLPSFILEGFEDGNHFIGSNKAVVGYTGSLSRIRCSCRKIISECTG